MNQATLAKTGLSGGLGRYLVEVFILTVFFCFFISVFSSLHAEKQTVCLNMIVKNEAHVIERCLHSAKNLIDYWVIVDTGSTDGTQEIIKKIMKDIPGELHERKWINFEHNRNEALSLSLPKGDYILFIDADEEFVFSDEQKALLKEGKGLASRLDKDCYYICCRTPELKYHRIHLIDSRLNWKWEGVLHEEIVCQEMKTAAVLEGIENWGYFDSARNRNPQKYLQDIALLEEEIKKNPANTRYVFYLANTYLAAKDYLGALSSYEKRVRMGGKEGSEIFWSLFEIARIQQILGRPPAEFIKSYHRAFNYRPSRIEPLYYLALYYSGESNYTAAYEVLKKALAAPPHKDGSFVLQSIYDYALFLQFADCAFRLKKYEEAQWACETVLKMPHISSEMREIISKDLSAIRMASAKKSVCLNMIVKNEAKVIERCLASVKQIVDYWVIVDTGSTDGTQQIIKEFMKDIPGELHERAWVDFEHNRNEALHLAQNKSDYLLFIDADEQLVFSDRFNKENLDKDYYYVLCPLPGSKYYRVQLVNSRLEWKWKGVLHEFIESADAKTAAILDGVVNQISFDGARSQNPQKYREDAAVLEQALQKDPSNRRYVFYLANSYRDAGDLPLALKNYEKRAAMGGPEEQDVFWSLFEIGRIREILQEPEAEIIKSYERAFNYRPSRIEPLYYLSRYYVTLANYNLAYEVLKKALNAPPHHDVSFVVQWIYDYGIFLQFADCAFRLKKYDEAICACEKILSSAELSSEMKEIVANDLVSIKLHQELNPNGSNATICLNMIVKNEAKVIERCLSSVKNLIDYWVIVDTGSTDGTEEIIAGLMQDIPGELHRSSWVDFEHNRNEALNLARSKGDYILFIDADEELVFQENFRWPKLDKDAYLMQCEQSGVQFQRLQLVRSFLDWRWKGVLHETLEGRAAKSIGTLEGIVNWGYFDGARNQDANKYRRDAAVLEQALEKDPGNTRYVFYLANSYRDAGDFPLALKSYQKRVRMGGAEQEEVFWSLFEISKIQELLHFPKIEIIKGYERAFNYRRNRIEPLYCLARYYMSSQEYLPAYDVLKKALAAPPHRDTSFVLQWIYDYGISLQFIDCAFRLEKYEEAIGACEKILKTPHLSPEILDAALVDLCLMQFHEGMRRKALGEWEWALQSFEKCAAIKMGDQKLRDLALIEAAKIQEKIVSLGGSL